MRITILILFFLISLSSKAQSFCSTPAPPQATTLTSRNKTDRFRSDIYNSKYIIRVYFHIVRLNDGTGGLSTQDINNALLILNNDFNPHGIFFEWNDSVSYVNNTSLALNPNASLFSIDNHSNGIDIYLCPQNGAYGGLGNGFGIGSELFVSGTDTYSNKPLGCTHVISHEMGHILNLYHTHHGTAHESGGDSNQCSEFADGSNSETCGDYVEDTPADPCLNQNINLSTCAWIYQGIIFDSHGDAYNPDTHLIMSYTSPHCMEYFTPKQVNRMKEAIHDFTVLKNVLVTRIEGETVPCGNSVYFVSSIPSSTSVIWSASEPLSSMISLDSINPNLCILNNASHTYINTNLVATYIGDDNSTISINKRVNTGANVSGIYSGTYEGLLYFNVPPPNDIYGTFHSGSVLFVIGGYEITLTSSFFNATVNCSGSGFSSWSRNGNTVIISTSPVSTTSTAYVTGHSGCNVFNIPIRIVQYIPLIRDAVLDIGRSEFGLVFTLVPDGIDIQDISTIDYILTTSNQEWDLTITNAITGDVVFSKSSNTAVQTVSINNWPHGIYLANVILGGKIISKKFAIDKE